MVTCKSVEHFSVVSSLDSKDRFVLPITWLYVMTRHDLIKVSDALLFKCNFTDEMLCDLILDFKMMNYKSFCASQYFNMICMYNDWKVDKQWYGVVGDNPSAGVYVEYKGITNYLAPIILDPNDMTSMKRPLNFNNPDVATMNVRYSKVLECYSKNVKFTELDRCKKVVLKG